MLNVLKFVHNFVIQEKLKCNANIITGGIKFKASGL